MMMANRDEFDRRLTTVLFADVVGYGRLSEADETGTHRALREALDVVSGLVTTHQGVVVHYAGDAVLAEFPTVMDGLNCAIEVQQSMAERHESRDGAPWVRFRIGLNVGDVIDDGGEIYGDTVNTAVRLQSIADPGGICISEAVRNAVGRQLPIAYEFVGEEYLKNLSIPVRAYRALLESSGEEEFIAGPSPRPSIAILPFENLSGTDDDADSLTEDLIRELSRFRGLEVIAHNSTFVYKGRPTRVQEVADQLGVEYVVEGHVRHVPPRMRLSVQLVSALTGRHIWSEVYDRSVEDSFDARDEVIRLAVAAIAGRVHVAAGEAAKRRLWGQLHAFEHVLRGQGLVGKGQQKNSLARAHYQRALALEPGNARALSGISLSYVDDWWNGGGADPAETLQCALQAAQQAYAADIRDSKVHWVLGLVHCLHHEMRQAARLIGRANALNPNDADGFAASALLSLCQDDPDGACVALSTASMLNPFPAAWYGWLQGLQHLLRGKPMDARLSLLEALQQNPDLNVARVPLAVACVEIGDLDIARDEGKELVKRYPALTVQALVERIPASPERRQRLLRSLTVAMSNPG